MAANPTPGNPSCALTVTPINKMHITVTIIFGNTLSDDGHGQAKFDYMLSNPPFGVEWTFTKGGIMSDRCLEPDVWINCQS